MRAVRSKNEYPDKLSVSLPSFPLRAPGNSVNMRIATVTPSSIYLTVGGYRIERDATCPLVNRPWIWVTVASDPNPVQQGGFVLLKKLGIGCGGLLAGFC